MAIPRCFVAAALALAAAAAVVRGAAPLPCDTKGQLSAPWVDAGPATYVDRADKLEISSASAAQDVAGVGKNWFVASVNGGVWRTNNLGDDVPAWKNVLDGQPVRCSSISAVAAYDEDTVVAGCGGPTSSEMGADWNVVNSGDWGGIMKSSDGGDTWEMTGFPVNYYVVRLSLMTPTTWAAGARSNLYNSSDGGVWMTHDAGRTWRRTLASPVFDILYEGTTKTLAAALPMAVGTTVMVSKDDGQSWENWSKGLHWDGKSPYYPCLAVSSASPPVLFVGALTVNVSDTQLTSSAIFQRELSHSNADAPAWKYVPNQPELDDDAMPKDRMALLVDPDDPELLYVAGNGGNVAWRAQWKEGTWDDLTANDTKDGSEPHVDCRNYAWYGPGKSLLLVSDGGLFMREQPKSKGGRWRSANGDIGTMEYLTAAWDAHADRWIAGAQDNDAQVSAPGAPAKARALGVIMGDGTTTAVDNSVNPARLFSTVQFLGQRDFDAESVSGDNAEDEGEGEGDEPEEDRPSLAFFQGVGEDMITVGIPVKKYFPDAAAFPYFVHPWALNTVDPSMFVFWVNHTASNFERSSESGFFGFHIAPNTTHEDDFGKPIFLETSYDGTVLRFVAGGTINGRLDSSIIVAMNNTHLYYSSSATKTMVVRSLPVKFAAPVILSYDAKGQIILGPVSHDNTVNMAISPADATTVVVTGWPDVTENEGKESVWITKNAGSTWTEITGNLKEATATVGMFRPQGVLIMELKDSSTAILVGTVSGVFVTFSDAAGTSSNKWSRLGTCKNLPLVLAKGLSYEPLSDTLLVATMGRGVFRMPNATRALETAHRQQQAEF